LGAEVVGVVTWAIILELPEMDKHLVDKTVEACRDAVIL